MLSRNKPAAARQSATRMASEQIYDNVDAVSALYERAEHEMPRGQRGIERIVAGIGRPLFLFAYLVLVAGWISGNMVARTMGAEVLDPPPFFWLQGFVTASSLLTTIVILIAQNRQSRLAERRAHLDLQVNVLSESKIAKVIALLEELRRDSPQIRDRVDNVAEAMQLPADPALVSRSLDEKTKPPL